MCSRTVPNINDLWISALEFCCGFSWAHVVAVYFFFTCACLPGLAAFSRFGQPQALRRQRGHEQKHQSLHWWHEFLVFVFVCLCFLGSVHMRATVASAGGVPALSCSCTLIVMEKRSSSIVSCDW